MKNLLLTLLFILPITAFAQQNNDFEMKLYLEKSIAKRKTGNVLLITGGGLILTGFLVATTGDRNGGWFISTNELVGAGMVSFGVLSALVSVPFYISAGHNKRKYLKLTPSASIIPSNSMNDNQNYAVVGLKISF